MKTRRLTTIMTSAYLSAMLVSSAAPFRSDVILAAPIDPMAAQKALQRAMNGLDAAGWMPASAVASAAVPPVALAAFNSAPRTTVPTMNEDLMKRLMKYTLDSHVTGAVTARICKIFELCDGTRDLPLKLAKSDSTDGIHYFGVRPEADSKDILILVKRDTILEAYLTDKTGTLRAAAISEDGTARRITNEQAAEKFKSELSLFAGEAEGLPPTGIAVVNNS